MNAKNPSEDNRRLSNVLRQNSKIEAALSPGFQEQVWQRIKRAEVAARHASFWWNVTLLLERLFARPSIAFSYVVALFLVGLTVGWTRGRDESARMNNAMELRYVRSVDPYQNPNP